MRRGEVFRGIFRLIWGVLAGRPSRDRQCGDEFGGILRVLPPPPPLLHRRSFANMCVPIWGNFHQSLSGEGRPKSGRCRPASADADHMWTDVDKIRRSLARFGRKSAQQKSAEVGLVLDVNGGYVGNCGIAPGIQRGTLKVRRSAAPPMLLLLLLLMLTPLVGLVVASSVALVVAVAPPRLALPDSSSCASWCCSCSCSSFCCCCSCSSFCCSCCIS